MNSMLRCSNLILSVFNICQKSLEDFFLRSALLNLHTRSAYIYVCVFPVIPEQLFLANFERLLSHSAGKKYESLTVRTEGRYAVATAIF